MKTVLSWFFIAAFSFANMAIAGTITTEVELLDTDPGSVQYVNFWVTAGGIFNISAAGEDSLGALYNEDPQIYLFDALLDVDHFIVSDDDSGLGYDALIAGINLSVGHYILAISQSGLLLDEAISGLNADSIYDPGLVRISIESTTGTAVIPEPSSLALLAIGFLPFAAKRRKTN